MRLHYCLRGTSHHLLVNVPKTEVVICSRLVRYIIQGPNHKYWFNVICLCILFVLQMLRCLERKKNKSMSKDYIKSNKIVLFKQLLNWTNYYVTCNNETRGNLGFCTLKTFIHLLTFCLILGILYSLNNN